MTYKRGREGQPTHDERVMLGEWHRIAQEHVEDLVTGRLPPEDVASNIAEDLRRAAERGHRPDDVG